MNDNNKNHADHDVVTPEQADATWSALGSGDRLGQAIKDSIETRLPESNPQLREMLLAKMPIESSLDKVALDARALAGRSSWTVVRWVLAASILFGLASIAWLNQSYYQNDMVSNSSTALHRESHSISLNPRKRFEIGRQSGSASPDGAVASGYSASNDVPEGVITDDSIPIVNTIPFLGQRIESSGTREVTILESLTSYDRRTEDSGPADKPFGWTIEQIGGISVDSSGRPKGKDGGYYYDRSESSTSGEQYDAIYENEFLTTQGLSALSTFSIDVDTASYANIRRFLTAGQFPPPNAVRIEEMVNYFQYDYPQPTGDVPFSVNMEVAACPWNAAHRLLRIGLKGKDIHRAERPVSNLVFLLDVSGSMNDADKLPLLKRGLQMMVDQLTENDRVSIVTYAGNAGLVLPPTSGDQKQKINAAIESLQSGGSTNGSAGIQLAYDLANQNKIEGGTNRVIWATDGDLNVGVTGDQQLVDLVSNRAANGVFLTVLGFGTGNLKDSKMEKIADKGNGMYAYIDSMREARKVLVGQMSGSLVTIAKDVKLQLEFNPGQVAAYRLIGYENRMLATEDFDNDAKDAGEIGAGHTVTAFYELVPAGTSNAQPAPVNLKYQTSAPAPQNEQPANEGLSDAAQQGDVLTLALRFKLPEAAESTKIEFTARDSGASFESASSDFRFAASVASFGMLLRGSKFRGSSSVGLVEQIASQSLGTDPQGYRAEFVDLVRRVTNR